MIHTSTPVIHMTIFYGQDECQEGAGGWDPSVELELPEGGRSPSWSEPNKNLSL